MGPDPTTTREGDPPVAKVLLFSIDNAEPKWPK